MIAQVVWNNLEELQEVNIVPWLANGDFVVKSRDEPERTVGIQAVFFAYLQEQYLSDL